MKIKTPVLATKSRSRKVNKYVKLRLLLEALRLQTGLVYEEWNALEGDLTGGQLAEAKQLLQEGTGQ